MNKPIDQFMWPFQRRFRRILELDIHAVLSKIGVQIDHEVKVLLIGLANKDDLLHQTCIEPENGPLVVDDLTSIETRTAQVMEADPESNVVHSNPTYNQRRRHAFFLRSRAQAIREAIEASKKFERLKFFVSSSATLGNYDIHTCVGIPREVLESVPRFSNPMKDDYHGRHIRESLLQEIIDDCLGRATEALYLPYPGQGFTVLGDHFDLIRGSAIRFTEGVTFALTSQPTDLFSLVNQVSSLTYERSGAIGHLVVTHNENVANKLKVSMQSPVNLAQARSVRKLLELTDDSTALLADSEEIRGLGECVSAPDVARILIEGHAKWSLSVDGTSLMKVAYEHASLPNQILDKSLFRDVARRTVGAVDVERIWDIFQCALDSQHGATIVVSENPDAELQRLGQEALAIRPEYLDHKEVARLGLVDGAIMLSPDGRCYAFGVILDGLATSSGDPARGARFNSAVRYQKNSEVRTMIIVISDDGMVDLIPSLMPRVARREVEDTVRAFCDYSGIEGNDPEEWARLRRLVERFAFYIDETQCDRVNEAYEKEMEARQAAGFLSATRAPLRPNPDMNDSYFEDE